MRDETTLYIAFVAHEPATEGLVLRCQLTDRRRLSNSVYPYD